MNERLQKVIANRGYCSRRKAEELIVAGRVMVNNKVVDTLGHKVGPNDTIEVEGIVLERNEFVYYLLNKPKDYICSTKDEKGRKVVTDLIRSKTVNERVYPVGRLDRNTTGVLLLTNDGEFVQTMTHPRYEVQKTYVATLPGIVKNRDVVKLLDGVFIEPGVKVSADDVFVLGKNTTKNTTQVEIVIHDGRYHQVKKMFNVLGYTVKQLKRIKYGNLDVDQMPLGSYRKLKKGEVQALIDLANKREI